MKVELVRKREIKIKTYHAILYTGENLNEIMQFLKQYGSNCLVSQYGNYIYKAQGWRVAHWGDLNETYRKKEKEWKKLNKKKEIECLYGLFSMNPCINGEFWLPAGFYLVYCDREFYSTYHKDSFNLIFEGIE